MKIVDLPQSQLNKMYLMHMGIVPMPAFYSGITDTIYILDSLSTEAKNQILREEVFHATHHRTPLLLSVLALYACPLISLLPRVFLNFFLEWHAYCCVFGSVKPMKFTAFSIVMFKLLSKRADKVA